MDYDYLEVKDINILVKLRSNLLLSKIRELFPSKTMKEVGTILGVSAPTIYCFINFKLSPVTRYEAWSSSHRANGEYFWKKSAWKLSQALETPLSELFPEHLWEGRDNTFEAQVAAKDLLFFSELRELLSDGNPEAILLTEEGKNEIDKVLTTIMPREEIILRKHFGLDGKEYTLQELADEFAVTKERIRQIEARALRKLRHPRRRALLEAY